MDIICEISEIKCLNHGIYQEIWTTAAEFHLGIYGLNQCFFKLVRTGLSSLILPHFVMSLMRNESLFTSNCASRSLENNNNHCRTFFSICKRFFNRHNFIYLIFILYFNPLVMWRVNRTIANGDFIHLKYKLWSDHHTHTQASPLLQHTHGAQAIFVESSILILYFAPEQVRSC